MTDREMLELAAKAAGLTLDYRHGSDAYYYDDPETGREEWKPHYDDGQALRLAAKLYLWEAIRLAHREVSDTVDIYAATRLAITRAAAEIGKSMEDTNA